jgi:hypothetical protein
MNETVLWTLLIVGQIFSAGNMNYQQEHGYYEINPLYPKHPSMERIIFTKSAELGGVYLATKKFRRHKKIILKVSNSLVYGFIVNDKRKGISMKVSFEI